MKKKSCTDNNENSINSAEKAKKEEKKVKDMFREWVKNNNWMCGYESDDEDDE